MWQCFHMIRVMKIALIIWISLQCCCIVHSSLYIEDACRTNKSEGFIIRVSSLGWSSGGHLRASRAASYQRGRNCTFVLSSPYDVIVSVKKIRFRPGCHDFLKIADGTKSVALCGTKNELDTNMQYYGKRILMNYFTDAEGPTPIGFSGFHLTFTPGERGAICDKNFNFLCDNGYCINNYYVCDNDNNCGDFSDEKKCSGRTGIVTFIAMFIVSIMGIVGGFCISVCLNAAISKWCRKRRNSEMLYGNERATPGRF